MRLIDADELDMAVLHELLYTHDDVVVDVHDLITNAPTVDAVPVVRCKDCKYTHTLTGAFFGEHRCCDILMDGYEFEPDDYCSRGERKCGDL